MRDPYALCPKCESATFLTYDEDSRLYHCSNPEWYRNMNPQQRFQCDDDFTPEQIAETKQLMQETMVLMAKAAKKHGFGFSIGDQVIVESTRLKPVSVAHPGETVVDYLDSHAWSQRELSRRTGLPMETIIEICNGKAPISSPVSVAFEKVFGRPRHFWMNLQNRYNEAQARLTVPE